MPNPMTHTPTQAEREADVSPDCWKLMPIDPTPEMVEAGRAALGQGLDGVQTHARTMWCYEAMVNAAPPAALRQPPADETKRHWASEEGAKMAREYLALSRDNLAMPHLSDFELANAVFLASRHDFDLISFQTAAKERIRWLSAQLAALHQPPAPAGYTREEVVKFALQVLAQFKPGVTTADVDAFLASRTGDG